MFNLNKAIAEWRRKLRSAGVQQRAQLDELESHLRDDIEHRIQHGAEAEKAFNAAVAGLGASTMLVGEFAKLRGPRLKSLLLLLRLACFIGAPLMLLAGVWAFWGGPEIRTVPGIVAVAILCLAAAYLAALPFIYHKLPAPELRWLALTFKVLTPLFGVLPLIALLDATRMLHLGASNTTVLLVSCLCVAYAFTILAYACRDQNLRATGVSGFGTGHIPLHTNTTAALEAAREEAERLEHHFIGTEHLLLGILRNQTSLLQKVFRLRNVDTGALATFVRNSVYPGVAPITLKRLYTPRAAKVLDFAAIEAAEMSHEVVGVEHILLGLLREESGVGGIVLRKHGFRTRIVRSEIRKGWDDDTGAAPLAVAT